MALDTVKYFGLSKPRNCPKTSVEVEHMVREKFESFLNDFWVKLLKVITIANQIITKSKF